MDSTLARCEKLTVQKEEISASHARRTACSTTKASSAGAFSFERPVTQQSGLFGDDRCRWESLTFIPRIGTQHFHRQKTYLAKFHVTRRELTPIQLLCYGSFVFAILLLPKTFPAIPLGNFGGG